jgi:hypothetical protein
VQGPGIKYPQAELASTFASFVGGLQGGKKWADKVHSLFTNTRIANRSFLLNPETGLATPRKAEEVMPTLIQENSEIAADLISFLVSG